MKDKTDRELSVHSSRAMSVTQAPSCRQIFDDDNDYGISNYPFVQGDILLTRQKSNFLELCYQIDAENWELIDGRWKCQANFPDIHRLLSIVEVHQFIQCALELGADVYVNK